MALASTGLQTQIWNNNLKSTILLLSYPLLIMGLAWALFVAFCSFGTAGYMNNQGVWVEAVAATDPLGKATQLLIHYAPHLVAGVTIWFLIAYWVHESIINSTTGAKPLERRENMRIYNMLENLCISRGMQMPKLYIIENAALNAYASGVDERSFTITLTRGIVNALDDEALEAVIAHELSHIRNRDVRLMMVSIIFVGIISFICEAIYHLGFDAARFGLFRSSDDNDSRSSGMHMILFMILAYGILLLGQVLALGIRMAISRRREYLADAGAVELTKNPDAMIRALRTISGHSQMQNVPEEVRQLFIENPSTSFIEWFASHPPIEDRIDALEALGGRDVPLEYRKMPPAFQGFGRKRTPAPGTSPWDTGPTTPPTSGPWG